MWSCQSGYETVICDVLRFGLGGGRWLVNSMVEATWVALGDYLVWDGG